MLCHSKRAQLCLGGGSVTSYEYVRTYTISFLFICVDLTLPLFKKYVFIRNGYFSPMRSNTPNVVSK